MNTEPMPTPDTLSIDGVTICSDYPREQILLWLAFEGGFAGGESLLATFSDWVADKSRPLGRILVESGCLDACRLEALEMRLGEHLGRNGGDPGRVLEGFRSLGPSQRSFVEQVWQLLRLSPDGQGNGDGSSTVTFHPAGTEPGPETAPMVVPIDRVDGPGDVPRMIGRYRVLRKLGQGGFGQVYLGRDDDLERPVAIKVPNPERIARPEDVEAYLAEARILARLDHPNIVPVFDVGRAADGRCFVVSKLVEGSDLAVRIKQGPLSHGEAAELVAAVAEALHYAHIHGLVHRDVKPANILLDAVGQPVVVDFGLALKDEDFGKSPTVAGTPAYMSPEQARGEAHRVNGRSDVFSLGVVLYELLTGRRPFRGDTVAEVLAQVTGLEVRPPRQVVDSIPKELERICLKALAKRAADRYTTARDLADDLSHFLEATAQRSVEKSDLADTALAAVEGEPPATLPPPVTSSSGSRTARIVPKGLRSFDQHDADFFLELLPGPRDRGGLPESIRFWKSRIEQQDTDQSFSVGLIYGPSGCGKSSLVKAGLLPRLSGDVIAVYLETTACETETRLLVSLRRHCPALPDNLGLRDSLAFLRRGRGILAGKKLLIVLDQFEQWLHAHHEVENSELVQALRQCDGSHVLSIVMVRDDFWMAMTRFLAELEIVLIQGKNLAAVDLFDLRHAKKVLAAFGQAFGDLPERGSEITSQQRDFVDQAVAGLAQDGKVICVRLALFAEMMKAQPWTPASLKKMGGAAGVGFMFLEEFFSASTANLRYRLHQSAARAVLQALLPDSGTDIKGHMRSYAELLEASGYGIAPDRFDELVRILDGEIRMITPTDPDGATIEPSNLDMDQAGAVPGQGLGGYYQLTHDYLVPALRQWLMQKQRETLRGRTEIRLADRARLWSVSREKRQLPSWLEYAAIYAFTRPSLWTVTEKALMKSASRYYLFRWSVALVLLALSVAGVYEIEGRMTAAALVGRLLRADSSDVPGIIRDLESYRRWAIPKLNAVRPSSTREDLHREVALLRLEGQSRGPAHIVELVPKLAPEQGRVVAHELQSAFAGTESALWEQMQRTNTPQEALAAATVLAANDPDDPRWETASREIAEHLGQLTPDEADPWLENLLPIGRRLAPPLQEIFARLVQEDSDDSQRTYVTALGLEKFLRQDPAGLARLLVDHARHAREFHCLVAPLLADRDTALAEVRKLVAEEQVKEQAHGSKIGEGRGLPPVDRHCNAALVELMLGDPSRVRQYLHRSHSDRTLRSTLIHRLAPLEIPPAMVISLLEAETESSVRAALLMSLGEYRRHALPEKLLARFATQLPRFRDDPDGEAHSAVEWLAIRWELTSAARGGAKRPPGTGDWYTNGQGQAMVAVRGCLAHDFALSATEVTVAQFRRFNLDYRTQFQEGLDQFLDQKRIDDCPAIYVSCYDSMRYCNWLSRHEGLDESQLCYEEIGDGRLRPRLGHLGLRGYRLPDLAEWRCGCRAGSTTRFSFGDSLRLLPNYAWYFSNSRSEGQHRARAVGTTKPNALGLFDTYGNVWEWVTHEQDPKMTLLCGGGCDNDPIDLQQVDREKPFAAEDRQIRVGFRLAQTLDSPHP